MAIIIIAIFLYTIKIKGCKVSDRGKSKIVRGEKIKASQPFQNTKKTRLKKIKIKFKQGDQSQISSGGSFLSTGVLMTKARSPWYSGYDQQDLTEASAFLLCNLEANPNKL